ncbi:MAG: nickel-dependent lactate racemase [Planctomycetota bacterium]|jgi:nickel-dependent lactate racemase
MKVKLAYGKTHLDLSLPDDVRVDIVEPKYVEGLANAREVLRSSLREPIGSKPLRELVRATDKVGIVFSDVTRPTPNHIILPVILDELGFVPGERIVLLNATGTHRPSTREELRRMLGGQVAERYRIVQNDAGDSESHELVGTTRSGNPIRIHREYLSCDVRILTGFIEPHFFAGFSGGPKGCVPGLADLETIFRNHSAEKIDDPRARWGMTYGNPPWEEALEGAQMGGPAFVVNVAMNRDKEITGVFAGDLEKAHAKGCAFVKETAMVSVDAAYDIVVASNSGYPADLSLYQSVKAMSAGYHVVKQGGSMVVAADCCDGIPEHGGFAQLLSSAASPEELLETVRSPGFRKRDMWQAQILALVRHRADVYFYSRNLTDEQVRNAFLIPCHDIDDTVTVLIDKYGLGARVCVLPDGPQAIPYLK